MLFVVVVVVVGLYGCRFSILNFLSIVVWFPEQVGACCVCVCVGVQFVLFKYVFSRDTVFCSCCFVALLHLFVVCNSC